MDKCPKCGMKVVKQIGTFFFRFACGTETEIGEGDQQSDLCRALCELATLKERHGKLVEAARKVVGHLNSTEIDFDYFKKTLQDVAKALKSEPSNNQNPADQGRPFDEDLEGKRND